MKFQKKTFNSKEFDENRMLTTVDNIKDLVREPFNESTNVALFPQNRDISPDSVTRLFNLCQQHLHLPENGMRVLDLQEWEAILDRLSLPVDGAESQLAQTIVEDMLEMGSYAGCSKLKILSGTGGCLYKEVSTPHHDNSFTGDRVLVCYTKPSEVTQIWRNVDMRPTEDNKYSCKQQGAVPMQFAPGDIFKIAAKNEGRKQVPPCIHNAVPGNRFLLVADF